MVRTDVLLITTKSTIDAKRNGRFFNPPHSCLKIVIVIMIENP